MQIIIKTHTQTLTHTYEFGARIWQRYLGIRITGIQATILPELAWPPIILSNKLKSF